MRNHIDGHWKCYEHNFGTNYHDVYIQHVMIEKCKNVKVRVCQGEFGYESQGFANESPQPWMARGRPSRKYNTIVHTKPI